jgi:hypothetical protein
VIIAKGVSAHFYWPIFLFKKMTIEQDNCLLNSEPLANHAIDVANVANNRNVVSNSSTHDMTSSVHAVSLSEKRVFVQHINKTLQEYGNELPYLPLHPDSDDIFPAVGDGLLLW